MQIDFKTKIKFIRDKGIKMTIPVRILCRDGLFRTEFYQKGKAWEYKKGQFEFAEDGVEDSIFYFHE